MLPLFCLKSQPILIFQKSIFVLTALLFLCFFCKTKNHFVSCSVLPSLLLGAFSPGASWDPCAWKTPLRAPSATRVCAHVIDVWNSASDYLGSSQRNSHSVTNQKNEVFYTSCRFSLLNIFPSTVFIKLS